MMPSISTLGVAELIQPRVPLRIDCLWNITVVETEGRVLRLRPEVGVGSDSYIYTIEAYHSRAGLVSINGIIHAEEFRRAELSWVSEKIENTIEELLKKYPCNE